MPLETGTFISDLNPNNPVDATDQVNEGDDHLRLIKSCLLSTFPQITGAVNLTQDELNDAALKSASNVFTAQQVISALEPVLRLIETDGPVDQNQFQLRMVDGALRLESLDDLGTATPMLRLLAGLVSLLANGEERLSTTASGLLLTGPEADGAPEGNIEFVNNQLRMVNTENSGGVSLRVANSVGGESHAVFATYDTGAFLYQQAEARFHTTEEGAAATGTDGLVCSFVLEDDAFNPLAELRAEGGDLSISNSGTGGVSINNSNGTRFETTDTGMAVYGALNNPVGGTQDAMIKYCNASGQGIGDIGYSNNNLYVRNYGRSGNVGMLVNDADGNQKTLMLGAAGGWFLYHNGDVCLKSQENLTTGSTSSALVVDHNNQFRPVGFNDARLVYSNESRTIAAEMAGGCLYYNLDGAYTLTCDVDNLDFPVGARMDIVRIDGSGSVTIQGNASTGLYNFNGTGTPARVEQLSIAKGGWCTIHRMFTNSFFVTGVGVS